MTAHINTTPPKRISHENIVILLLIVFGTILRLGQYIFNRSLWLDELLLAENLVDRSILQLLTPLSYDQGAPLGFLIFSKLIACIFGYGELVLRIIPFLSGALSIVLLASVSRHLTDYRTTVVALLLFTINDQLIYYSSEFKQYSSDVLFALLILFIFIRITGNYRLPQALLGGLVGLTAIFFSHPSVFVLAGIGTFYLGKYAKSKQWRSFVWLAITSGGWLVTFATFYYFVLQNLERNTYLSDFWKQGMLTNTLLSLDTVRWAFDRLLSIFTDPLGMPLPLLGIFLAGLGAYRLLRHKKDTAALLILPIFFTLLASLLHKYPFSGRLILFLTPIVILLISSGVNEIASSKHANISKGLCTIVLAGLVFQPFYAATYHLLQPRTRQETRPVIQYIVDHMSPNDTIYLYYPSTHAYNYYSKLFGLKTHPITGIKSREDLSAYLIDLNKLRGKGRVWILFSRVYSGLGTNEEVYFVTYLNKISTKIDYFSSDGASVYLYDFDK
jgi:uncharacterized membrane protein